MAQPSFPQRAPAFTLVELLVVITLIAILTAILVPMAGGMRVRANQPACASNMRQIGMALTSFASENGGSFPVTTRTADEAEQAWIYTLAPFPGSGRGAPLPGGPGAGKAAPAARHQLRPQRGHRGADHGSLWRNQGILFQHRGPLLASGGADGRVFVWDLTKAQRHRQELQPPSAIAALSWSPDDAALAIGAADGSVCVWESSAVKA